MTIGKALGFPPSVRTYNETTVLPLAKCLTGVEFECENVKLVPSPGTHEVTLPDEVATYWKAVGDDSLRDYGMEFVLREPLFGEDLLNSVAGFCKWAKDKKFEANYRTGLHIHIDARNMEHDEIISMIIYYALFEPIIFRWVGDDREGSIFCMPFYKAEGCVQDIAQAFDAPAQMKHVFSRVDRYGALNLNALSVHGSVEWRHMKTTFDMARITKWICICQAFKRYARKFPLKPMELLATMSKGGPYFLLKGILGPELANELWYDGAEHQVWSYGLPIAQDIAGYLDTDMGAKWNNIRALMSNGPNPAVARWAEKQKLRTKKDFDEVSDSPFTDPGLLTGDPVALKAAEALVLKMVREVLDTTTFNFG